MVKAGFRKGEKMIRLQRALKNPQRALTQIGAMMVAEAEEAFEEQAFGEAEWEPRGVPNVFGILQDLADGGDPKSRRFEPRPALVDTTLLSSTIDFEIGDDYVLVGSNLEYAGVLHHGGPVESVVITKEMQVKLREWLDGTGKEHEAKLGFITKEAFLGEQLDMEVPARPFVGVTKQTIKDIEFILGVEIFEVKG